MKNPLQTFPVSAGLLEPKHVQTIGRAVWVFLWFLNRVTRDEQRGDDFVGIVLNGRPLSIDEIAAQLGLDYHTCRRHVAQLVKTGDYIERKRAGAGLFTYVVTNSKKWAWQRQTIGARNHRSISTETQADLFAPTDAPTEQKSNPEPLEMQSKKVTTQTEIQSKKVTDTEQICSARERERARDHRKPQRSKPQGERAESEAARMGSAESQQPPSLIGGENRNPRLAKSSSVPEFACKMIEVLALTNTIGNRKIIEAAIVAEAAYCGYSPEDAAHAITHGAMEDRRRGVAIDRWYFEDAKWRRSKAQLDQGKCAGDQDPLYLAGKKFLAEREADLARVRAEKKQRALAAGGAA